MNGDIVEDGQDTEEIIDTDKKEANEMTVFYMLKVCIQIKFKI